jgi:hypothetical protein
MRNTVEAMRYIDNAKDILREKAKKEDGLYLDKKYVRMAGHTAYLGVLVALDELLGNKKKGRKSVEWYQKELSTMDKKISSNFSNIYDTLHLALSYDGNQDAELAQNGIKRAEQIINWVDTRLQKN